MAKSTSGKYALDDSLFSPWRMLVFIVCFSLVGSLAILNSFAASPPVSSFAIAQQYEGTVEFSASTKLKVPNDLVVTNTCYSDNSAVVSRQTQALGRWITDPTVGYVGYATFSVPYATKCSAFVHKSSSSKSMSYYSYVSM